MNKVLMAAPVHEILSNGLEQAGYQLVWAEKMNQEIAFSLIQDCVGVITSTRIQLDKNLIEAAPNLKWIGRMGSGMEVIDLEYAALKGILCFGSPDGNCNAVAEHAMGLLLNLTKKIHSSFDEIKQGLWLREENRGFELEGKTVGIIGFGHTGTAFAKKLRGFDVSIVAYDKYKKDLKFDNVRFCENLSLIYEQADVLSFHVPQSTETKNYFNTNFLASMKKPFLLLNTSRGNVVSIKTLFEGLQSGKIIGAGLDVLPMEPISKMDISEREVMEDIMKLPQVIVTPHIAGYSVESLYKMSKSLFHQIVI